MAREGEASKPCNWPLIIGLWALVSVGLIASHVLRADAMPFFSDSDDAMRMVTSLDLANGQHWQDNIQHRDNFPYGTSMHWSRLIDAPIAGLFLLLRPLLGAAAAADAAAMVWPMLLTLPLILLSVALTRRLVGPEGDLPAILLPLVTMLLLAEFMPGRVDHHNVQVLLTGTLALATMAGRAGIGAAIAAGLLAATSMAVGGETLPLVAVGIGLFGLFWAANPNTSAAPVRAFALSLAGFTLLQFLLATPPSLYLARDCDALSITYVVASAAAGAGLLLATFAGSRLPGPWSRFALLGTLGAASAALTVWFAPHCLDGPYAGMDADVLKVLFPTVAEARSLWVRLLDAPATTFVIVGTPLIALGLTVWRTVTANGAQRVDWLVLLAFAAGAMLVTAFQIRGARLTAIYAVPAGAWLITQLRRRYQAGPNAGRAVLLILGWLLFATILHFAIVRALASTGWIKRDAAGVSQLDRARTLCFQRRAYDALAALPPGAVIAPMLVANTVLYFTPHAVVGTGFHRNQDGTRANVSFFNSDERTARSIASAPKNPPTTQL